MGFDADVFSKKAMPETSNEFFDSYTKIFGGEEDRDYDSLAGTDPILAKWFQEMIERFPALNGEFADWEDEEEIDEEKEKYLVDYCIGSEFISFSSPWSIASELHEFSLALAKKYGIGYHDASTGVLWAPGMKILYRKMSGGLEVGYCWTDLEKVLETMISGEDEDDIELRLSKDPEPSVDADRLRVVVCHPKKTLFSGIFGTKKKKTYDLEICTGGKCHRLEIEDENELRAQVKNFCYKGKLIE
ncbi:MAG: hypothetical protein Q4A75_05225 [Peptostreptococcaceae bacterium]|nr:hypothetical protein [Peptostreptococcaceae bacterium]